MDTIRSGWLSRTLVLTACAAAILWLGATLRAPYAEAAVVKSGRFVISQSTNVAAASGGSIGPNTSIEGTTFILLDTATGDTWISSGKATTWTKMTRE